MSLRHGLQAIVRVIRRRVQQQAQQQIHSPRQTPDGVPVRPGTQHRAAHAEAVTRSSKNLSGLQRNSTNFANLASKVWAMTPRVRIPLANGSRILPQSRPVIPLLLGFAGVGFVSQNETSEGVGAHDEASSAGPLLDLETAVHLVHSVFRDHEAKAETPCMADFPREIDGYAISERILAKGTEGVVYAAKRRDATPTFGENTSAPTSNDEVLSSGMMTEETEEREAKKTELSICDDKECNLAVKMMFNYNVGSTPDGIATDFHAEQLPLSLARGQFGNTRSKERHPNIVQMYQTFVDDVRVPSLQSAVSMFDMALPQRLNSNGLGADLTFYIVMKRYKMSLREYLGSLGPPPDRTAMLIITQLLEAVWYLGNQGAIHRDLKSNNILVENHEDGLMPHIVVADFGCAISLRGKNLLEQVTDDDRSRAGNTALMAPEVKKAFRKGNICYRDYLKSDAWAVGAIAYEVCGQQNPFYLGLNSETYSEESLPQLQTQAVGLKIVVERLLLRDPNERPTPIVAADILHQFLWQQSVGGLVRLCSGQSSQDRELVAWLMKVSLTYLLCDGKMPNVPSMDGQGIPQSPTERKLLASFLGRVNASSLKQAALISVAELSKILVPILTTEFHRHCNEGIGHHYEERFQLTCQV